ncbi:MAG: transaldolase family protein, partial [Candidatus Eiseniibacteriota bacterium]
MSKTPCVALHELGQSVWLDNINDGLIQSGELARLIAEGSVYGVTSNPTIFKNAIAGDRFSYPSEIARLAGAGKSPLEIYDLLAVRDITRTADLLADTYRRGTGRDGFVSLEVPPSLAHDTAA